MELIPDRGPSPGQGRMSYRSEGLSEQPRQQPAGHNDRQEVEPTVFLEIPYINDDAFSEESLDDEEVPQEGISPVRPESSAKMKGELDVPMPMWTSSNPVRTIREF